MSIHRIDPGETVGPFVIEIPSGVIAYLRWEASLPWWKRMLARHTPAWRWLR